MKYSTGKIVAFTLIAINIALGLSGAYGALGMEPPVQVALAILLVGAILWVSEAVPLFVTSLVILFLARVWLMPVLAAAGQTPSATVYLAPFFSDLILLFLGGFVLSSILHKLHIDEDLARQIISRTGHSIPLLIAGIMAVTAFLSMWLSNTATTAMMLALCLPIVHGLPRGDKYRTAIILAVPFAANAGGMGTPIGTPPNAIAIQYLESSGIAPSFGQWILMAVPCVIICLAAVWGLLLVFYRGEAKQITVETEVRAAVYSRRSVFVIAVCCLTVLGWMTKPWHGLSSGTVSLIPLLLFFGTGFLNTRDLRDLSWDVLLVMGGGLCLGKVIATGGLADWLIARLPVAGMDPYLLAIIFGGVAITMSSLMSNTATANLMMPILIGLGSGFESPILISVAFCCSLAMVLPISTPPNAMAFSTEEIAVKDMVRPGLAATAFGFIMVFSFGWWWWGVLGVL